MVNVDTVLQGHGVTGSEVKGRGQRPEQVVGALSVSNDLGEVILVVPVAVVEDDGPVTLQLPGSRAQSCGLKKLKQIDRRHRLIAPGRGPVLAEVVVSLGYLEGGTEEVVVMLENLPEECFAHAVHSLSAVPNL